MVMCRLPMMRAPASGLVPACCFRSAIRPGISCSARRISLRPKSASERSLTLKGCRPAALAASNGCSFSTIVAICASPCCCHEQPWTLCTLVWSQGDDSTVLEVCVRQKAARVFLAEAKPDMAHLLTIAFAIVRQHVHEQKTAARLDDARHSSEGPGSLWNMMHHHHQPRPLKPTCVERQRVKLAT